MDAQPEPKSTADPGSIGALLSAPADGFRRADVAREFAFPRDHGPHPDFRSEWWYVTGNLHDAANRPFGFQLTFFRFALASGAPRGSSLTQGSSVWRTRQAYLAHFALSDIAAGTFNGFQRSARAALEMAGARASPCAAWVDDWRLDCIAGEDNQFQVVAGENGTRIDLNLTSVKPPVLQGDAGLSQKSGAPGNASYYYSLSRLHATGSVTVDGRSYTVSGDAWLDREWSTSALGADQIGWDWFGLQLDDGRELMFYRLRRRDGGIDPHSAGTLISRDGTSRRLRAKDVQLDAQGEWRRTPDDTAYPGRWRLRVPRHGLDLLIEPKLPDQEWRAAFRYWEGAVTVSDFQEPRRTRGQGYLEMTGYAAGLTPAGAPAP